MPRELQWEKIIKTKQKKYDDVSFIPTELSMEFSIGNSVGKIVSKLLTLFIMSITKGISNEKFCRYFQESSRTVYFLIALLITVRSIKFQRLRVK